MPGVASYLDRHEWTTHGTCFTEKSADAYFRREIALIEQINTSPVQKLLPRISAGNPDQRYPRRLRPGLRRRRTETGCASPASATGGRRIIVEMTIGACAAMSPIYAKLADLIAGASPTNAGCNSGIVDPVGLQ